ncbi:hypothetical protein [Spirosoma panaciterrae]|uniref:hypothetical protein n=1 Tax=Spirosoma panaciterrae TaxID=496058 RepID=UPI00316AC29B
MKGISKFGILSSLHPANGTPHSQFPAKSIVDHLTGSINAHRWAGFEVVGWPLGNVFSRWLTRSGEGRPEFSKVTGGRDTISSFPILPDPA